MPFEFFPIVTYERAVFMDDNYRVVPKEQATQVYIEGYDAKGQRQTEHCIISRHDDDDE